MTWRDGTEKLLAVVVERRPADYWKRRKKRKLRSGGQADGGHHQKSEEGGKSGAGSILTNGTARGDPLPNFKADEIHYYVHYVAHDR